MLINSSSEDLVHPGVSASIEQMVQVSGAAKPTRNFISLGFRWTSPASRDLHSYNTDRAENMLGFLFPTKGYRP